MQEIKQIPFTCARCGCRCELLAHVKDDEIIRIDARAEVSITKTDNTVKEHCIFMATWNIRIEQRKPLMAVYAHVLSDTPEEDVSKIMMTWANRKGLLSKEKGTRMFGRNTYPTNKPEPHGYQLFMTVNDPTDETGEVKNGKIPGGHYAVLRSTTIPQIPKSWSALWKWIEKSEYMHTGWVKGEYGWVSGFEENLSLFDDIPPEEWKINLMIPVKKKNT